MASFPLCHLVNCLSYTGSLRWVEKRHLSCFRSRWTCTNLFQLTSSCSTVWARMWLCASMQLRPWRWWWPQRLQYPCWQCSWPGTGWLIDQIKLLLSRIQLYFSPSASFFLMVKLVVCRLSWVLPWCHFRGLDWIDWATGSTSSW